VLLISISLLLVNCQKDETFKEETNQAGENHYKSHLVRKTLNESDIKNNTALSNILSRLNSDFNQTAGRGSDSTSSDYYILTDTVIYIESEDGSKHSYTFAVLRDSIDSTFENLVMSSKEANFYEFYLVKYNTTQQEREALKNGQPVDLTNKIDFVELDEYGSTTEVINKELVCTTVTAQYCTCDVHDASSGFSGCQCYESISWTYCEGGGGGSENDPGNGPGNTGDPGSNTGGTTMGTQFETEPYIPTAAQVRWKNFKLWELTNEQKGWLTNIYQNQPDVYEDIHNFLENDISPNGLMSPDANYNVEAIQFAIEAIISIHFGGDVDFEEKILSYLPQCKQDILDEIQTLPESTIRNIVRIFCDETQNDDPYNWIVKQTYQNDNRLAKTNETVVTLASGSYAETQLNESRLSNATDLLIAQVLMHEAIHSYIVNFYHNHPWSLSNGASSLEGYEYGELISEYIFGNLSMNDAQHNQFIRDNMVDNIALALKHYGQLKGYNLDDQYYENLAWAGLQETTNYENQLSSSQRNQIELMLEAERTGMPNGSVNPNGTRACD